MQPDETFETPDDDDFHGRKRELLRQGIEQGTLSWSEISQALPPEHLGEAELEVFLFTCRNLGIEVVGTP